MQKNEFLTTHVNEINKLGNAMTALAILVKFGINEHYPLIEKQLSAKRDELTKEIIKEAKGVLVEGDLKSLEMHIIDKVHSDNSATKPSIEYFHNLVRELNQSSAATTGFDTNNVVLLNASSFFARKDTILLLESGDIPAGLLSLVGANLNDYPGLVDQMNRPNHHFGGNIINAIPLIIDQYGLENKAEYLQAIRRGLESSQNPSVKLSEMQWRTLNQWISEAVHDVSKIEVDESLIDVVTNGGYFVNDEVGWVDTQEHFMERLGIDYHAATRLQNRIGNILQERYIVDWNNSHHGKLTALINSELDAKEFALIHREDQTVKSLPSVSSGIYVQYIPVDGFDRKNLEAPVKLSLFVRHDFSHLQDSKITELTFDDFKESDIPSLMDAIQKNDRAGCYGYAWAKANKWMPHEIKQKHIGYNDLVREYFRQAEAAGLLPDGVKYTVSKPYYNSILVTISKLPEGLPVYNPEYQRAVALDRSNEHHYQYYTPQYKILSKVMKVIAEASVECTDDGNGSDYGVRHNYSVSFKFKESLEDELKIRVQEDVKSGVIEYDWQYLSGSFIQKEAKVSDKLPIAKKYEITSLVDRGHRTINNLQGQRRDEYFQPYNVLVVEDTIAHINEFRATHRLPKIDGIEDEINNAIERLNLYKLDIQDGMNFQSVINSNLETLKEGVTFERHLLKIVPDGGSPITFRVCKLYPVPVDDLQYTNVVIERVGDKKPIYTTVCKSDYESLRQFIEPVIHSKVLLEVIDMMSTGVMKPVHGLSVLRMDDYRELTIFSPLCFENKTLIAKTDTGVYLVTEQGKTMEVKQQDQVEKIDIILKDSSELFRLSTSSSLRMEG